MVGVPIQTRAEEYVAPVSIQTESTKEQRDLSEQFSTFQIMLGTEVYSFPTSVSQWEQNGWKNVTEEAVLLASGTAKSGIIFEKGETRIFVSVENQEENRGGIAEGSVIGISMDLFGQNGETIRAELPGGIVLGMSTLEEIEQIYGIPTSMYEGENYTQITYQYGTESYLRLDVEKDTNIVQGFEIENVRERKAALEVATSAQASEDGSDIQETLGETIDSGNVVFDSHVYRLPTVLSDFLEEGFEIVPEESDKELASLESGFVVLQKENRSVKVCVKNNTEQTRQVQECIVTSLESSLYQNGFSLILPGGIEVGMTRENLENALGENEIVKEESENFLYYGIAAQNQTLDEISIFVEKETGLVVKIQIEKEE